MIDLSDDDMLMTVTADYVDKQRNELLRLFAQITDERQRRSILEIVRAAAYANDARAA